MPHRLEWAEPTAVRFQICSQFAFSCLEHELLYIGMGKCELNENWLDNHSFVLWWKPVQGNQYKAHNTRHKFFRLGIVGIKAVDSHMACEKHKTFAKTHHQTPAIYQYCSISSTPVHTALLPPRCQNQWWPYQLQQQISEHRLTPPLHKAEVFWYLHIETKHRSCNTSGGVWEIFQAMFPDSEIAYTFVCGKDKSA